MKAPWSLLLALSLAWPLPAPAQALQTWRREATGLETDGPGGDAPVAVGSLQKPFVAKAWAATHPGEASPRFLCEGGAACWQRRGHGELGLAQALVQSCNAYFRHLAAATPSATLAAMLTAEGFPAQALTPDLAIGLAGDRGPLAIRPSRLLEAYLQLVRSPWSAGEPIRQQVLAGLRESALSGTAAALGQRGYWAKTGTVPLAGSLRTAGVVVAVDDAGWAILARLEPGTGAQTAAALAGPLRRLRPGASRGLALASKPTVSATASAEPQASPAGTVTLRLFELLRPQRLRVRNLGSAPVPLADGYLGAGSTLALSPGDRVGPGLLEVSAPDQGLLRRLEGTLFCEAGGRLLARVSRREYVGGILEGELPRGSGFRLPLGAAALRFLEQPRRHRDADVCDSTHCAWFVGRGPRLSWSDPAYAQPLASAPEAPGWGFTEGEWDAVLAAARQPGPRLWTSHCGGLPLSPHALWGQGDTAAAPCLRHGPSATRPWVRSWPAAQLAKAFGQSVTRVAVAQDQGRWVLRLTGPQGTRSLPYDAAHRLLAKSMGWAALPSPADAVEPVPGGWSARGVGLGHRVGLCLGD